MSLARVWAMTNDPAAPTLPKETAFVESATLNASGNGLVVRGSVEHRDALPWESTTKASLVVQGAGQRFEAHFEPLGDPQPNMRREWSAQIKLSRIPPGTYRLRLEFGSRSTKQRIRTRPSIGMERSSRSLREREGLVQVRPGPKRTVVLCRQTGRRRLWQIRWHRDRLFDDLRAIRVRELFAFHKLVRMVTQPLMRNRVDLLICERTDTAQDNGFALFEWIRRSHPAFAAYYVVSGKSEAWHRVHPLGKAIRYGSMKHRFFLLHARVLASSQDIDAYLLPPQWDAGLYRRHLAHRIGARRIFLQHGVITSNGVGPRLHRRITGLDAFICSSPDELSYLRRTTGYTDELVPVGLARFDSLLPSPEGRRIFVMPTWRSYLVQPSFAKDSTNATEAFDGSAYQRFWTKLLGDVRLLSVLRSSQTILEFVPHYEVASQFKAAKSPEIIINDDGGSNLQQSLRQASLCISDYSSIVSDAAYLGIPIVHVPFDESDFYSKHYTRGWFDFRRDGFGPVVTSVDDLVDAIIHYIDGDFEREAVYRQRAANHLFWHDRHHLARTFAVVAELVTASGRDRSVQSTRSDQRQQG